MTTDTLTAAAALADGLPDGPWAPAPWQQSLVLTAPWAADSALTEPADRGPFLSIACSVGSVGDAGWPTDATYDLAKLAALLPDLVLALAHAENEVTRTKAEARHCTCCAAAPGEACASDGAVTTGGPGWAIHPIRLDADASQAIRRIQSLPPALTKAMWQRYLDEGTVRERPNLAESVEAIRRAEGKPIYRQTRPGPEPMFTGSNPDRQSVGLPGHCEDCAQMGHVKAHPELGCTDVGCYAHHDEPAEVTA